MLMILSLLMFFVVTAGAGLATLQITQSKDVWMNVYASQTYYLAEAGIQEELARTTFVNNLAGRVNKLDGTTFGTYNVTVAVGATDSTLVSTGRLVGNDEISCKLQAKVDGSGYVYEWKQLPP